VRLDVRRSPALRAVIEVLATAPREVAKEVRNRTKATIVPEYKGWLAERAPEALFHERLVAPSTAYVSDRGIKLVGGSNKPGMFPRETEFGAYREDYNTYNTKAGPVTRRTQRQFWHFVKPGRVFWPTVQDAIPRIAAMWTQTAYRTVAELTERATRRG
jgi:hypothetical protein